MFFDEKDVNPGSSPENQDVNPGSSPENKDVNPGSSPEVKPSEETPAATNDASVDERGVEWKNVAHEALDKIRRLQERLPEIIKEAVVSAQPAKEDAPKYTKAQLRAFAEEAEDQSQKAWAYSEIEKIERQERQSDIDAAIRAAIQKQDSEKTRAGSFMFVANLFPEAVIKDAAGNPVGWNTESRLVQRMNEYLQRPELRQAPDGLVAAAKMAAFDLGISDSSKLQKKVGQVSGQLKREQKKQLISGGGAQALPAESTGKAKLLKAAEDYRKTGSKASLQELLKARGLMPQI